MNNNERKYIEWMYRWIRLNQEGVSIEDICKSYGLNKIAIYGFNLVGNALLYELCDTDISVEYVIDRNKDNIRQDFKFIDLSEIEKEEKVDAIILCVRSNAEAIIQEISRISNIKVITFEDLIYEI